MKDKIEMRINRKISALLVVGMFVAIMLSPTVVADPDENVGVYGSYSIRSSFITSLV